MTEFIESIRSSVQLMTFLTLLALGSVYILASFILSHFGAGHDEHEHDHGDTDTETVSIFSPKIIALFAVGNGIGGALSTLLGAGPIVAPIVGLVCGSSFGVLMVIFMRMLYRQQASSNIETPSTIGLIGTMSISIDSGQDGQGEIDVYVQGNLMTFPARSANQTAIWRGQQAKIVSASGSILIVSST